MKIVIIYSVHFAVRSIGLAFAGPWLAVVVLKRVQYPAGVLQYRRRSSLSLVHSSSLGYQLKDEPQRFCVL